ncbi:MAG: type II toxin-antitoxin system VapC family toxin [Candidatus Cyclonatronum sp.]|uniref:type II toxin-antitoxin system VapC family toxin n=1 Tax=Cyclonatronum sp. TaxID=3024185 RepID=UPI0025C30D8F|nr:type II toxin-antitoxin system VapC family toxin [Cyclonatronum sp.]MCH8485856.1 type II toxin-antitoxin system VapC family toxin [Cyclonatronum sp.]
MLITIDTSALLAVLLNEQHKLAIIDATEGHDLQAPASLDAEVGNALSAMFKRKRITLNQAHQVLALFDQIPIRRTPLRLPEATEIAIYHNIYAYDAYVLDCAQQHRSPLLSLDFQLIQTAQNLGINLVELHK